MSHTATGRATTPALLTALRVVASLTVLALLWQFVTAGAAGGGVASPRTPTPPAPSCCTSCPGSP